MKNTEKKTRKKSFKQLVRPGVIVGVYIQAESALTLYMVTATHDKTFTCRLANHTDYPHDQEFYYRVVDAVFQPSSHN